MSEISQLIGQEKNGTQKVRISSERNSLSLRCLTENGFEKSSWYTNLGRFYYDEKIIPINDFLG